MKTVVSLQDLVDPEIHPGPLLREFRALTAASVATLLEGPLVDVGCPACASIHSGAAFEKFGLAYRSCTACGSVFASPRPTADALRSYAESSPAATFWRDRVLRETSAARAEKLIGPRAEWVAETLAEYCPAATTGLDLSQQGPPFLQKLATLMPTLQQITSADASRSSWTSQGPVDFVAAFDTFDRAADLRGLVAQVEAVLGPSGLLFVTAPSISGFDLQVLWGRSNAILPPDKLNLLSIEGFARLFSGGAWEMLELSTPGMFDVENVRQAMLAAPDASWSRGVSGIVLQQNEAARQEFQEYLQRHRLASFARLVVRRT